MNLFVLEIQDKVVFLFNLQMECIHNFLAGRYFKILIRPPFSLIDKTKMFSISTIKTEQQPIFN